MSRSQNSTQCYVDESVHHGHQFVVSAFVFTSGRTDLRVARVLKDAGLQPGVDEVRSGIRMIDNPRMRQAREHLLSVANSTTRVGVFVGAYGHASLGRHCLQALQSIVVRNAIPPSRLNIYFDEDIFRSTQEARRLHALFHYLKFARVHPKENSRTRLGIQIADVVAGSVAQIVKEALTGKPKTVNIGGPDTGCEAGTMAPLGWNLLMALRYAFLTRPSVCHGEKYSAAADPVVLDLLRDDAVTYAQHLTLLGWGVQVAPEAPDALRNAVDQSLGRIWLGCVH